MHVTITNHSCLCGFQCTDYHITNYYKGGPLIFILCIDSEQAFTATEDVYPPVIYGNMLHAIAIAT